MMEEGRGAYTLIELIYVIVIIGIMAAIIIPKLAANRNDARAATIARKLAVCITDAGGYYLKKGHFDTILTLSSACDATINEDQCFSIDVNSSSATLTVTNRGESELCMKAHLLTEKNKLSSATGVIHAF